MSPNLHFLPPSVQFVHTHKHTHSVLLPLSLTLIPAPLFVFNNKIYKLFYKSLLFLIPPVAHPNYCTSLFSCLLRPLPVTVLPFSLPFIPSVSPSLFFHRLMLFSLHYQMLSLSHFPFTFPFSLHYPHSSPRLPPSLLSNYFPLVVSLSSSSPLFSPSLLQLYFSEFPPNSPLLSHLFPRPVLSSPIPSVVTSIVCRNVIYIKCNFIIKIYPATIL